MLTINARLRNADEIVQDNQVSDKSPDYDQCDIPCELFVIGVVS